MELQYSDERKTQFLKDLRSKYPIENGWVLNENRRRSIRVGSEISMNSILGGYLRRKYGIGEEDSSAFVEMYIEFDKLRDKFN